MKLYLPECPCDVYVCDIRTDTSLNRCEREELALRYLLDEAFGVGAERRHACACAPVLYIGGVKSDVCISVSHSRHHAVLACGAGGMSVGVDVEAPREQLLKVSERVLSSAEHDFYSSFEGGLLLAWTLKEALYKASRSMLEEEPCFATQLRIPVYDGSLAQALERDGRVVSSFSTSSYTLPDGEIVTVVFTNLSQYLQ